MTSEILDVLVRINLAATAAIALVMLLRGPLRRAVGARLAYGLWLAVPIVAAASLIPPRKIVTILPEAAPAASTAAPIADVAQMAPLVQPMALPDWPILILGLWIAGASLGVAWLIWRQRRFLATVGLRGATGRKVTTLASGVGPAVVGAIVPKILLPADFNDRFSPKERDVVLAHEEFHLRQGHAQTNALVLLSQCLNWFNPAIHVAARALRLDQELACDAAVVEKHPNARRAYAEAMLKTQVAPDLLLGCYWPASGSALRQRLRLLQAPRPTRGRIALGVSAMVALTAAAGLGAWAAQPPEQVYRQGPATASQRGTIERIAAPSVDPGKAVQLEASYVDPEGGSIRSAMSFVGGREHANGAVRGDSRRYGLETSVRQSGDRIEIFALLQRDREPLARGSVTARSGERKVLTLDNGEQVTVAPMLQATEQEVGAAPVNERQSKDSFAEFSARAQALGAEGRRLGAEGRALGVEGRRLGAEGRALGVEGRAIGEMGKAIAVEALGGPLATSRIQSARAELVEELEQARRAFEALRTGERKARAEGSLMEAEIELRAMEAAVRRFDEEVARRPGSTSRERPTTTLIRPDPV